MKTLYSKTVKFLCFIGVDMYRDDYFLKEAVKQAKKALSIGDVPIGCVIVFEDKIIARGYNRRNKDKSTLSHAEILAMKKACKKNATARLLVYIYKEGYDEGRTYFSRNRTFNGLCGQQ